MFSRSFRYFLPVVLLTASAVSLFSADLVEPAAASSSAASEPEMSADAARDAAIQAESEAGEAALRAQNDARALDAFQQGRDFEREGLFRKAAKRYLDAELLTSNRIVKANALSNASRAYRKAELFGREFDCLERLLDEHMSRIDFTKVVNREYEIADAFFNGHRDTVFEWLPFVKDSDRFLTCAEAALRNAPCSEFAPAVRLRLGRMYLTKQKPEKAIEKFKEVLQLHPESESAYYANLGLADVYCQLAERGDGDNRWAAQAIELLDKFAAEHPAAPDLPWVLEQREKIDIIQAKRLHELAQYHHRTGRDDLAEHYLAQVVQRYGATEQAVPSEQLLAKIDAEYIAPPESMPRKEPVHYDYPRNPIPLEDSDLLIAPESSDGKWLLPIRDLKKDIKTDSRESFEERTNSNADY